MKKYVLVSWPEVQDLMLNNRWEECIFCSEIEGHPVNDSTYAVPEDLYNEVYGKGTQKEDLSHDVSEIPTRELEPLLMKDNSGCFGLFILENGKFYFDVDSFESWDEFSKVYDICKWYYLNDLL